ncbi:DPP IV N-terminal domain-containing protein [Solitalea lacus]|uniref:DPP IV N-terminal domain-containing protein n=1 Tax=Solitalea lacus TaxID=2911172 RepID=UPI0021044FF6|nr:DPP IV N-terminal domain-containing protein [Solitalea lacus]
MALFCYIKAQPVPSKPIPLSPYKPTHSEVIERYQKAALLDSMVKNTVFKMNIQPNWQADGNSFWYRNYSKDSTTEYIYVDAVNGKRQLAFDQSRLAEAISKVSGKPIDARRMQITTMKFESSNKISLQFNGQYWQCDLSTYNCTPSVQSITESALKYRFNSYNRWTLQHIQSDSISPDKKWFAFIKNHNVYMRPVNGGAEVVFTSDGTQQQPYGEIKWSPDSKYFIAYKINPKEFKEVYYVLSSVENTTRGLLKSQQYPQPGDEFTNYEMFVFHVDNKQPIKVNTEKYDFLGMPYPRWNKIQQSVFHIRKNRPRASTFSYH